MDIRLSPLGSWKSVSVSEVGGAAVAGQWASVPGPHPSSCLQLSPLLSLERVRIKGVVAPESGQSLGASSSATHQEGQASLGPRVPHLMQRSLSPAGSQTGLSACPTALGP